MFKFVRHRRILAGALLGVFIIALPIYLHFSAPSAKTNLILISLDTLRADRLSSYGYERLTDPNLASLAKKSGVIFEDVVSVSSWTLPVHVSMLSGLYPTSHGVIQAHGNKISPSTKLLSEILHENGYRTFAFTGGGYLGKSYGFSRGFEVYDVQENVKYANKNYLAGSIAKAVSKISELKGAEPYFLFLHTYGIHCPYNPPRAFTSLFNSPDAEYINPNGCGLDYSSIKAGQVKYISDRYDQSIRWIDDSLPDLFSYLENSGELDHTVVVITSDHGEEFMEHGRVGHQRTLYREVLKIPLVIFAPQIGAKRISTQVSNIDLFPTLIDLLGLPKQKQAQGVSLLPLIKGKQAQQPERAFQYSELSRRRALHSSMTKETHLIHDMEGEKHKLFDLINDPNEKDNLASKDQEQLSSKISELDEFDRTLQKGEAAVVDEKREELKKLKSLGYF